MEIRRGAAVDDAQPDDFAGLRVLEVGLFLAVHQELVVEYIRHVHRRHPPPLLLDFVFEIAGRDGLAVALGGPFLHGVPLAGPLEVAQYFRRLLVRPVGK